MSIPRLLRTLRHLRPRQVAWQVIYRLHKSRYKELAAPQGRGLAMADPIAKARCCEGEAMTFLGITMPLAGWEMTERGMLWAYNLNYMDFLLQGDMDAATGARWIDRFIASLPANRVGTDPYPTALRAVNWIKFISRHGAAVDAARRKEWDTALYSSCRHLERRLERHLLGNHLLEDAYALTWGALYFADRRLWRKATALLRRELTEQTLPDGAHYEQSPMYHCILLDRLLDCYNVVSRNTRFARQEALAAALRSRAEAWLGHLESMTWADGTLPAFGDTADGIAPSPGQLFAYARRLGLAWQAIPLGECGYRHLACGDLEAFCDVAGITASYQPGHSHADTFSYELRVGGKPLVVDTGITTYDKTPRRQYERSTAAHNTVTIGGRDTSEVWGGFRVGRRARVTVSRDTPQEIAACHDGYACHPVTRRFRMADGALRVVDEAEATAVSRIHLAPGIAATLIAPSTVVTPLATIDVHGSVRVTLSPCQVARKYNRPLDAQAVEIEFTGRMDYTIKPATAEN